MESLNKIKKLDLVKKDSVLKAIVYGSLSITAACIFGLLLTKRMKTNS